MWYIVYREPFKSYTETGGGYFVKYKNKIEDTYSSNWFEAQKYKSLGAALTRLNINISPGMDTMDKFLSGNKLDKRTQRDLTLSKILGESIPSLVFKNGRIEKISDDGQLLGDASDDVMEFIKYQLEKNRKANEKKMKVINEVTGGESEYIIETKEGEDFWEGF